MHRWPLLGLILAVATFLEPAWATGTSRADVNAAEPGRSYWQYRDANGVLHVTNVRKDGAAYRVIGPSDVARVQPRMRQDWQQASQADVGSSQQGAKRYAPSIQRAAKMYDLPAALIFAVMHTESRFHPNARSSVGAQGLMQLMPSTASWLGVVDAWDPEQNILGGAKFLRLLANRFNGDMVLVLAAYHAGAGAVKKYGGVPPYSSTRAYVQAVLQRYYAYESKLAAGDLVK